MVEENLLKLNSFNSRGLGSAYKRRCVFQWLKQFHRGITLLQETHTTEAVEKQWLQDWDGPISFSHGTNCSRGVAILFPKELDVTICNRTIDDEGRFILLEISIDGQNFTVVNVYAPTKDKEVEQIRFIDFVLHTLENYGNDNLIIGGDLNTCLDPKIDKKGGIVEKCSLYAKKVLELNEEFNLVDIWRVTNPDSQKYTWRGRTRNGLVQSRLDYWLISTHLIYNLKTVQIKPGIKSDHSIVNLHFYIKESPKRGRGFWKFNCSLLYDQVYVNKIKEVLANCETKYSDLDNKALLWDAVKCEIRSETISYSSWKSKQKRLAGQELQRRIETLEKNINDNHDEYIAAKHEFDSYNDELAKGIFIRSRAQFIEDNEKSTKYFLQQEKQNYKTKHITALKIDSNLITNPKEIMEEQEKFYKNLYSKPSIDVSCGDKCSLLQADLPTLTENDKTFCDKVITLEECGKGLQALPNNKSPGSDGFTTEFYKFFWINIKHYVYNSFIYSFENGLLSIDQRRAILTLLPKPEKDLRLLKNWRPLSLLNTDYKILTKLLASHLQKLLPNIINEDQTGYLKGRYIGENIRSMLDVFELTNSKIDPGIIMFLDFEKAFDTISWQYLFYTLKAFNFGTYFINWIKIIYTKPTCCIINNGYSSQFFELSRGVRQGCQISALLFILVAEIMSINIRNDKKIHGLNISTKTITISQLADDTTIFLNDYSSIKQVFSLLEHFHKCAGLKLNKEKTEAVKLGQGSVDSKSKFGIKWVTGPVKVLGLWVGKDKEEVIHKNFDIKLEKLRRLINMWKARNLSIKGKITLLRSKILPIVLYPLTVLYVPDHIIDEIDALFFDFIWPGKKHHVKKHVLIQGIEDGGLKMPDISSMVKAMKISWVNKLINKDNNFTNIAKICAKVENFENFFKYKNDVKYLSQNIPLFYKQVIQSWYEIFCVQPHSKAEILDETLWNNKYILVHDHPIFYDSWERQGITKIHHIVDQYGQFKSPVQLNRSFGLNINIMHFNSLKSALPKSWLKVIRDNSPSVHNPTPLSLKIQNKKKEARHLKCKDFYWEFVSKKFVVSKSIQKWEEYYYYLDFDWKYLFKLPYLVARETKLQSLQFKVLNRYIPCKDVLNSWGKEESNKCLTCNQIEDLEHYFCDCDNIRPFWISFNHWFSTIFNMHFQLQAADIIFGIMNANDDNVLFVLNFCILFAKDFIHDCRQNGKEVDIMSYKGKLNIRLLCERHILESEGKHDIFINKWSPVFQSLEEG